MCQVLFSTLLLLSHPFSLSEPVSTARALVNPHRLRGVALGCHASPTWPVLTGVAGQHP